MDNKRQIPPEMIQGILDIFNRMEKRLDLEFLIRKEIPRIYECLTGSIVKVRVCKN